MYSSTAWVVLGLSAICLAPVGTVQAQSLPRPQPSVLWVAPRRPSVEISGPLLREEPSSKQRGLLLGALIGGAVAGFLGNRVCRAYSATTADGCLGDTLWWAAGGAMLGGLIGATGSGGSDP